MDINRIIKEQRDMILKKYGFDIKVEETQLSDYKYTIKYGYNGGYITTIYRDTKDELDSLLQLIFYMDSMPYKVAYTAASAYDDCYHACFTYANYGTGNLTDYIRDKYIEAKKVELCNDLTKNGISNISSLHCNNILVLELSKKPLSLLYTDLKWLKETADQKQVDYESLIPIEENTQSEI